MEHDFLFIGKSAADKALKGRNEEYHEYFITDTFRKSYRTQLADCHTGLYKGK